MKFGLRSIAAVNRSMVRSGIGHRGFGGEVLAGGLGSRTAFRLIKEWTATHCAELDANWNRIKVGETLERIAPLD